MSPAGAAPAEPAPGRVDAAVAAEHPGLGLWSVTAAVATGPADAGVLRRLRDLSDRFGGAQAAVLRTKPVPHAHRAFFRQIGLDPDHTRVPAEALAVERLLHGSFESRDRLTDAITVAVAETAIGVWALDAAAVDGALELRLARSEEPAPDGQLVVADAAGPLAPLFGEPGRALPARGTRALVLYAIQVPGVSALEVGEALWIAAEIVAGG